MITIIHAVYENQSLRLPAPLPLKDGATIEVTLNLEEPIAAPRKRFSWEDGSVLPGDGTNSLTDELRRQRDGE